MMAQEKEVTSGLNSIETMILMAAYAGDAARYMNEADIAIRGGRRDGSQSKSIDHADSAIKRIAPTRSPKKSFTFDLVDSERLFTLSPDYLIDTPDKIIGDGIEVIIPNGEALKWYRVEPMSKKVKRCTSSAGGRYHYLVHERLGSTITGRWYSYRISPASLDSRFNAVPARFNGQREPMSTIEGVTALISCSVVEDCLRKQAITASISLDSEIMFPISYRAYQDALIIRDAPTTKTGRKNPIIHWVGKHERTYKSGKKTTVIEHKRGITDISVDGINLSLSVN